MQGAETPTESGEILGSPTAAKCAVGHLPSEPLARSQPTRPEEAKSGLSTTSL